MVIWLVGLSGSGKTTLGKKLKEYFINLGKKAVLIDGDEVRNFFNSDLGYSKLDRVANIKRIQLAAYFLSKTDVIPIICNISPFEELRQFSREKIEGYLEVYLKKNIEECIKSDVKSMYEMNTGVTDLVGKEIEFDQPLQSDLICDTDSETVDESFSKIVELIIDKQSVSEYETAV